MGPLLHPRSGHLQHARVPRLAERGFPQHFQGRAVHVGHHTGSLYFEEFLIVARIIQEGQMRELQRESPSLTQSLAAEQSHVGEGAQESQPPVEAFKVMVQASALSSADGQKLTAIAQATQA